DFDRPYRAVLSLVYNTRPISSLPRFAQLAAANWQVSGIAVAQSGSSLAVTDSAAGAVHGNFENRVAAPTRNPLTAGSLFERTPPPPGAGYMGSSAFPAAPIAPFGGGPFDTDFGDSSVGFLRSPAQRNIDMAVERAFPIHETNTLHLRAECFNLTTTQFANPDTNLSDNSSFGVIRCTAANPRIVQFAARYTF
ncbi:MAG TPA: hypothetical protein VJU82_16150, partial [Acidobacteriaceae bacterium]|nr:hypothetical protein [Acidobacteriaceae bacterium]